MSGFSGAGNVNGPASATDNAAARFDATTGKVLQNAAERALREHDRSRFLLTAPPLLFLDEPTSGVDPEARRAFWDVIYELADGGTTVFASGIDPVPLKELFLLTAKPFLYVINVDEDELGDELWEFDGQRYPQVGLNAIAGRGVHLVTVNDYLARRDADWMGKIYGFLGLTTGVIVHGLSDEERRQAYASDVTYATNNELGFDYLRDNLEYSPDRLRQRDFNYAIVDEIDSILIDEARTPLIISGPAGDSKQMYDILQAPVDEVVKVQRDLCNKLATEARRGL